VHDFYKKKHIVSLCALRDTKATGPTRISGAGLPPLQALSPLLSRDAYSVLLLTVGQTNSQHN
jgi:hypothetical protein